MPESSDEELQRALGKRGPAAPSGYEYRSQLQVLNYPFLHVVSGRDPQTGRRRTAKGVIAIGPKAVGIVAIGQFAFGVITVAQVGAALWTGLGQVMLAGYLGLGQGAVASTWALGQFAFARVAIGQLAIGKYALGQIAFGPHVYTPAVKDPAAVQYFHQLAQAVKEFLSGLWA